MLFEDGQEAQVGNLVIYFFAKKKERTTELLSLTSFSFPFTRKIIGQQARSLPSLLGNISHTFPSPTQQEIA